MKVGLLFQYPMGSSQGNTSSLNGNFSGEEVIFHKNC
jgi:hypothetical protein